MNFYMNIEQCITCICKEVSAELFYFTDLTEHIPQKDIQDYLISIPQIDGKRLNFVQNSNIWSSAGNAEEVTVTPPVHLHQVNSIVFFSQILNKVWSVSSWLYNLTKKKFPDNFENQSSLIYYNADEFSKVWYFWVLNLCTCTTLV